jgi:membrane-associated phospholipid phosphatase
VNVLSFATHHQGILMRPFSTTQPPHKTKVVLDGKSTTQPPSNIQSLLTAMNTGHGLVGLIKKGLKAMRAGGHPHLPSTPTGQARPVPPSFSHGADAIAMVAADELLGAVSVASSAWRVGGPVPSATVAFNAPLTAAPVALPAVDAAVYVSSVGRVSGAMNGPVDADAISFEAPMPALVFALALGMESDAGSPAYPYPYTALLMDIVTEVVTAPTHRLKHLIRVSRPSDSATWNGMAVTPTPLPVPGYSAYPSGHATLSQSMAIVLASLGRNSSKRKQLERLAADVGKNRERAGLHTDIDTGSGLALGEGFGDWLVLAANSPADFPTWSEIYNAASAEW